MAAACEAPVRLRLLFDYPPPGSPACGLCWLLLEPIQVRLITDLISLIRDKFGFSRRAKLSLFLDGALLPPTESARLVRDNDSLRVKLEAVIEEDSYDRITNGFNNISKKQRKRHRQKLEAYDSESEYEEHRKRKRSKQQCKHSSSQEDNVSNVGSASRKKSKSSGAELECKNDDNVYSKKSKKGGHRKRPQETKAHKKKKKASTFEAKNTLQKNKKTFPLSPSQKNTANNIKVQSDSKNGGSSTDSSTSSSDIDDSTAGTKQKQPLTTKVASQHTNRSHLSSPIAPNSPGKLSAKQKERNSLEASKSKVKSQYPNLESDSTSEEEENQQSRNPKNRLSSNNQRTGTDLTSKTKTTSSSGSDSSESENCIIKKPNTSAVVNRSLKEMPTKVPPAACGLGTGSSDNQRGRGRGESPFWRGPRVRGCRGIFRGRGRGRGEDMNTFHNYTNKRQKEEQLNESATNSSVIIQNPVEVPKKDYSKLPLLAAPPQVGEKIAFKLLELTENYTPEVSNYKEGKIVSWNPINKQLELELLSFSSVARGPGKFDLVYQSADGAEAIENTVSQDRKIIQNWDALIEPRLIVDSLNNESSTV
nr:PREDICTED: LOW QUALITY PROTEIN: coilin [Anolis carolinensis]|eukprot:XP_008112585.2 PREDICTED: LOW QUALITY PROTEIN: coilin [Anolis carolinensis]